jgi:diguanylate cyclase (GGDEF)-like protein
LTGLANRRAFEETLARETALAERHGHALSVVVLKIDRARAVNDTHGHPAGDEALRSFVRTLTTNLGAGDGLYRYGDKQFAVILPHTDLVGAKRAANRLEDAVAATVVTIGATQVSIKVSAGVACLSLRDTDPSAFLSRAFTALHKTKSQGSRRGEPCRQQPRAVTDGDVVLPPRQRTD